MTGGSLHDDRRSRVEDDKVEKMIMCQQFFLNLTKDEVEGVIDDAIKSYQKKLGPEDQYRGEEATSQRKRRRDT